MEQSKSQLLHTFNRILLFLVAKPLWFTGSFSQVLLKRIFVKLYKINCFIMSWLWKSMLCCCIYIYIYWHIIPILNCRLLKTKNFAMRKNAWWPSATLTTTNCSSCWSKKDLCLKNWRISRQACVPAWRVSTYLSGLLPFVSWRLL